jgi:hypothetical protein
LKPKLQRISWDNICSFAAKVTVSLRTLYEEAVEAAPYNSYFLFGDQQHNSVAMVRLHT